jgi:hypothetical protein
VSLEQFSAVQNGLEQLSPGLNCSKLSSGTRTVANPGGTALEDDGVGGTTYFPKPGYPFVATMDYVSGHREYFDMGDQYFVVSFVRAVQCCLERFRTAEPQSELL